MKPNVCKQVLLALYLTALAWPVGATPSQTASRPSTSISKDLPPTHFVTPSPPALLARIRWAEEDKRNGENALRAKDYKTAEQDFRSSVEGFPFGEAYCGLAECLLAQGRKDEAMQTFRLVIVRDENHVNGANATTRGFLQYAILLSQSGKWAEAVSSYQSAVQTALLDQRNDVPKYTVIFDSDIPQPKVLEISAHIALGLDANSTCDNSGVWENDRAFEEYGKALALMPDSPLTNFFYGYGWQHLDPKDRVKLAAKPGQREAVKATLEKAAKLGTDEVQVQAKKELARLR